MRAKPSIIGTGFAKRARCSANPLLARTPAENGPPGATRNEKSPALKSMISAIVVTLGFVWSGFY
jgi:hypothetical protein